jgi:hypothetical protein
VRRFKSQLLAIALGAGLALGLSAAPNRRDHDWEHSDLRGLVERTQNDLSNASRFEHGHSQAERFEHAEDELSSFDRGLSKGHFDKGHLDRSIEKVQSVLDHNTLEPAAREALRHDVDALRMVREHHEH